MASTVGARVVLSQSTGTIARISTDGSYVPKDIELSIVPTNGEAFMPATTIAVTPSLMVDGNGRVTTSVMSTSPITPSIKEGWVSSGTSGIVTVSGSSSYQLLSKSAETFTPGVSAQVIPGGTFLVGDQTILGDPNLVPENIAYGVSIFGVVGTRELLELRNN